MLADIANVVQEQLTQAGVRQQVKLMMEVTYD